ncbi:hypothetical protein FKG94_15545 [Exilibacterium tricleocarpae]|uniref:Uncharacterized protein n=1 Tax=Exilibacterium tricleocarpae TaxID=2591008 RepID=A0A545TFL8_9GAMM|nr:hypothetical protein [Exilibacterium tricleocarpae]TQV76022.1 hypothetical protein FKG94_15545 [Exilibacterium tricleocarpae]
MSSSPVENTDLLGGREIHLLRDQPSVFPNLQQLRSEFDFRILEIRLAGSTEPQFVLVTGEYRTVPTAALTPAFASLAELDAYAGTSREDIQHEFLFGFVNDDINLANDGLP